jgi:O-antigen/teichoic acid export membrane protein
MRTVSRVVRNSIALMSGQVYGVIINLLAISVIARYLSLEAFGEYGFILAVCVTLSMIADMGINRIAIREISREEDRASEIRILTATVMGKALLSIISFGAIMTIVWVAWGSPRILLGTTLCAIATIIKIIGDIPEAVFKAYERMKNNAYLKIVEDTSYILGVLAVVTFDFGLIGIFTALLFSSVIRISLGIAILSRGFFMPRLELDAVLIKWIFKEAVPIGFNRIFRKAALRIDTIILKLLRTTQEVGLFHGVYRIILIASIIPFNITEALFPIYSRFAKDSQDSLRMAFEKSFKLLFILVLPLVLITVIFAGHVVHFFLGEKFSAAIPLMRILVFLLGFRFLSILCTKILNASDQQRRATYASGVSLAVNVVLDIILIYSFGYMGAAFATLVSEMLLLGMSLMYVNRYVCRFDLWSKVKRLLLIILLAGGTALFLQKIGDIVAASVSVVVYVVLLFAFKIFEDDELNVIREGIKLFHVRAQRADLLDIDS